MTRIAPRIWFAGIGFKPRLHKSLSRLSWAFALSGTAHAVRDAGSLRRPIVGLRPPDWPEDRVVFSNGAAAMAYHLLHRRTGKSEFDSWYLRALRRTICRYGARTVLLPFGMSPMARLKVTIFSLRDVIVRNGAVRGEHILGGGQANPLASSCRGPASVRHATTTGLQKCQTAARRT